MNYKDIGARIRNKRKEKDITQEKLAEQIDISVTHMSHIETGSTKLSLPVLVKIANALKVSTDELICDNLITSKQIYISEIAEILDECDQKQTSIITDIVRTTKQALDKHY